MKKTNRCICCKKDGSTICDNMKCIIYVQSKCGICTNCYKYAIINVKKYDYGLFCDKSCFEFYKNKLSN